MKIMTCPVNGPRNIAEFQWLGPVHPDPEATDENLIDRLFHAPQPMGTIREWWRHMPSNTVFMAERHLITDDILRTWLAGNAEGAA